jgi:hypothetical protein
MKGLLLLLFILSLFVFKVNAQIKPKIDTIYYLLDTAKIPVNDKVWKVSKDSDYQYYTILCPCVQFNGSPTFINVKEQRVQTLSKAQLERIQLTSLPVLIVKAKQFLDSNKKENVFFIIEPAGKRYLVHQMILFNPEIHIVSSPDVVQVQPDNNAFEKKGLLKIAAKDMAKYVNQTVITTGKVISTSVNERDKLILLYVNTNFPDQGFTIFITNENRRKFDAPELYYKGKPIRVVGKVTVYEGKPAIMITDVNQIQLYTETN